MLQVIGSLPKFIAALFAAPVAASLATLALAGALAFSTSRPALAYDADYYYVVAVASNDALNMRSAPSARARIKGRIPYDGQSVEFLAGGHGSWMLVRYNGITGWVNRRYLAPHIPVGSYPGDEVDGRLKFRVSGVAANDILNMRAWPGARSRIVSGIPPFASGVSLIRRHSNGWALVSYQSARGWVNERYLRPLGY